MRRPIVAGNWKMHKTAAEAADLAAGIVRGLGKTAEVEVVLCPAFTALREVADRISGSRILLGAQNVHWEPEGAYTGEISTAMLLDSSCRYVILGHSERRTYFGETDEQVNRKAKQVLGAGMTPIVCVGETLEQREAGQTEPVVRRQVEDSLRELGEALGDIVIAYEPVWAIGTGRVATTEQAQSAHAFIRGVISDAAGAGVAQAVRIQYGGSVKPDNAPELFSQPDVDGGLIGGASLQADSFVRIVKAAA